MPLFLSHVAVKIRGLCSVYIVYGANTSLVDLYRVMCNLPLFTVEFSSVSMFEIDSTSGSTKSISTSGSCFVFLRWQDFVLFGGWTKCRPQILGSLDFSLGSVDSILKCASHVFRILSFLGNLWIPIWKPPWCRLHFNAVLILPSKFFNSRA